MMSLMHFKRLGLWVIYCVSGIHRDMWSAKLEVFVVWNRIMWFSPPETVASKREDNYFLSYFLVPHPCSLVLTGKVKLKRMVDIAICRPPYYFQRSSTFTSVRKRKGSHFWVFRICAMLKTVGMRSSSDRWQAQRSRIWHTHTHIIWPSVSAETETTRPFGPSGPCDEGWEALEVTPTNTYTQRQALSSHWSLCLMCCTPHYPPSCRFQACVPSIKQKMAEAQCFSDSLQ